MGLTGLTIEGFGHFHNFAIQDFGPGLHIVYGPNEAGKSTLSRFLTFVLFGPARGERPAALAGGRPGGRLTVDGRDGRLTLERFDRGPLVARRADGRVLSGEEALHLVLGGLDRTTFDAVWSFALEDLRSLEGLGNNALRERLFSGAVVGAGKSVTSAVDTLRDRASALWKPRAASPIGDAEQRLAEVTRQIAEARRQAREYAHLQRDHDRAEQEHPIHVAARREAEAEARRWQMLMDALPHHRALRDAEERLDRLPAGRAIPDAVLREVDGLNVDAVKLRARHTDALRRVEEIRAAAADLPPPSPLVARRAEVQALARRAGELPPDRDETLRDRAESARRRLQAALDEAGLPDAEALQRLDRSADAVRRLHDAARLSIEIEERQRDLREAEARAARLAEDLARATADRDARPRDPDALAAGPKVREIRQREAAIADARRQLAELEDRRAAREREVAERSAQIGPHAEDLRPDLRARVALEAAVQALSRRRLEVDATASSAAAEVARWERVVAEAQMAAEQAPPIPELPADGEQVLDGLDEALTALTEAQRHRSEASERADSLRSLLQRLGPGWNEPMLDRLQVDAGSKERLRAAAAAVEAARVGHEDAIIRHRQALEAAQRAGIDPTAEGPTNDGLDERASRLSEAEYAIRSRDEIAARAARATIPPWARGLGIAAGLVLMLLGLGIGLAFQTLILPGLAIALLGLLVALAAWFWLRVEAAPAATTDLSPLQALHLGPAATQTDILRLRAALERDRAAATHRDAFRDALVRLTDAEERLTAARKAWRDTLTELGWPAESPPAGFESLLAEVARARELREQAVVGQEHVAKRQGAWESWCGLAAPVARALAVAPPTDRASAKTLAEAIRQRVEDARAARRRRQDLQLELESAHASLRSARAHHADVQRRLDDVAQEAARLRAQASALGVPESVPLDGLRDWLASLTRLNELRDQIRDLADQAETLRRQIADGEQRFTEVITQTLGFAGPDALTDAEARCARAEALERQWREAEEHHRHIARQEADAARARDDLRQVLASRQADAEAWARTCAAVRAPETLTPAGLASFLAAAGRASEAREELAATEAERATHARLTDALLAEVRPLAEALALPLPTTLPEAHEVLRLAEAEITRDRERLDARERTGRALAEAEADAARLAEKVRTTEAQRAAVLQTWGVEDADALRALHEAHQRHAEAEREVEAARKALRAALGHLADDATTLEALAAPEVKAWQAAADLARQQAEAAEQRANEALERKVALATTLDALRTSGQLAELEAEAASLEAGLAHLRRTLAVNLCAQALLNQSLQRFREAHQPAILRRAGDYLARATGHIYTAVEPDADDKGLLVVDAGGGRRAAEHLSTGTTTLLYLVLRLGLVEELAQRAIPMPLLMDDVLLHLDTERAAQAANLLAAVAAERQVLLFTCRPETRDLLVRHVPAARVTTLPRFAGRNAPAGGSVATVAAAASGLHPEAERILEALEASPEPLPRQVLLERARVPESAWQPAIRQLKEAGLVRQDGVKRGAVYSRAT